MNRKVIKARDVMREKHIEMDGLATVREALNAMKTDHSEVVIVKKRDEHDAFGIVLISDIAELWPVQRPGGGEWPGDRYRQLQRTGLSWTV
jgi:hypothetical protein